MGYACPVCSTPQADAGHLANHLAFTALLHGGEHEAWLDEHVPEWESLDESTLAERAVEFAEDADYPQVFEDTTGQGSTPADSHGDHHTGHGHRDDAGDGHAATSDPDRQRTPGTVPFPVDDGTPDSAASLLEGVDFSALREDEDIDDEELDEIIEHARDLTRTRREDSETE